MVMIASRHINKGEQITGQHCQMICYVNVVRNNSITLFLQKMKNVVEKSAESTFRISVSLAGGFQWISGTSIDFFTS